MLTKGTNLRARKRKTDEGGKGGWVNPRNCLFDIRECLRDVLLEALAACVAGAVLAADVSVDDVVVWEHIAHACFYVCVCVCVCVRESESFGNM